MANDYQINDIWFAAEAQRDGLPVFIRGRNQLQDLVGLKSHSSVIRITWEFEPANAAGMPDKQLHDNMQALEQTLFDVLEAKGLCIFYSIYLHNGMKEWSAYCCDTKQVIDLLNQALGNHEKHQINIGYKDDPEWVDYLHMLETTGQGGASAEQKY